MGLKFIKTTETMSIRQKTITFKKFRLYQNKVLKLKKIIKAKKIKEKSC